MLIFVISCNLLLTLCISYLAFRLWKLHCFLKKMTKNLTKFERCLYRLFNQAPESILQKQQGIYQLRHRYQKLLKEFQTIKTILRIFNLGLRIRSQKSVGQPN